MNIKQLLIASSTLLLVATSLVLPSFTDVLIWTLSSSVDLLVGYVTKFI